MPPACALVLLGRFRWVSSATPSERWRGAATGSLWQKCSLILSPLVLLLAPVYGWFTEGVDTLDLKEAKGLLEELA